MKVSWRSAAVAVGISLVAIAHGAEPPQSVAYREIPGIEPTPWLTYQDPGAESVFVAGTWNAWNWVSLAPTNGLWTVDTRTLGAAPGRHEFKFVVNEQWEDGANREFYLDEEGLLARPPDAILKALQEDRNEVLVYLRNAVKDPEQISVRFSPPVPVKTVQIASPRMEAKARGYRIAAQTLIFTFDPELYDMKLQPGDRVAVAGNFNHWDGSGAKGQWLLQPRPSGVYELAVTTDGLRKPDAEPDFIFKYVLNGNRWLNPPADAVNVQVDQNNNRNLVIDTTESGSTIMKVITEQEIPLSEAHMVVIEGVADRAAWHMVNPGRVVDSLISDKPLGATLDKARGVTTYRLFAPRASAVHLCLYDTPAYHQHEPEYRKFTPAERYPMWRDDADGVWEITLIGLDVRKYYSFNVDGPSGPGEDFHPDHQIADPYMLAAAHAENNSIVIDLEETNQWFSGWTDDDYRAPDFRDMVIYEAHLRDLTAHESSGVPPELRGKYAGLMATLGQGTGLDHLKELGINMIEFLPLAEFNNKEDEYNWGYTTVGYFAPEASYARDPLRGSQVYEFKQFVNDLHRQGFGVIVDVVYNHVGWPNLWAMIDRKYYFRLTPDFQYLNFSGVGNDFRTEAPMARRMVVDSIKHWVREFKVDGFRWDLAELVDMDTLMEAKREAEKINPRIIMISEPWSFRGNHKAQLRGTGWSAWNDDFRYAAKDYAQGRPNRDWTRKIIAGSTEIWTANPLQAVNYVESHDDMALADVLSTRSDQDGRLANELEIRRNKLAATLVFTSLGIPMINNGQEFHRSKHGIHNTYNQGDEVNAIRWTDREKPLNAEVLSYYKALIALRQSDQGKSFRVTVTPPEGYLRWITPPHDERLLGFILNSPRNHPGNGFIVLFNPTDQAQPFEFELPAGAWRVIGDGKQIDLAGLAAYDVVVGPRKLTIRVPETRALIMMDGF
ncbi:MAG: hypothetical protein H7A43_06330 [Verrucomicrobia bacterium]|nr:hypothetical protein [Kiritimatiellia bacterium]MCP5488249.1 hypothetical protein [Verrucomicrobiota bacterium]